MSIFHVMFEWHHLQYDNLSTVLLSSNPILRSRTKHMELDLYFIKEKVMAKQLLVQYAPTFDQVADILTKPLLTTHFERLKSKISVVSPTTLRLTANKTTCTFAQYNRILYNFFFLLRKNGFLLCFSHFSLFRVKTFIHGPITFFVRVFFRDKNGFLLCFPHFSLFTTGTFIHAQVTLFEKAFYISNNV